MLENTVKYKKWDCKPVLLHYSNGNPAIKLVSEAGEPIATATVNLGFKVPEDTVLVKDYAENEGMLKALVEAGIVKDTGRRHKTGYVEVCECLLT